jgi:hypothetical protein
MMSPELQLQFEEVFSVDGGIYGYAAIDKSVH